MTTPLPNSMVSYRWASTIWNLVTSRPRTWVRPLRYFSFGLVRNLYARVIVWKKKLPFSTPRDNVDSAETAGLSERWRRPVRRRFVCPITPIRFFYPFPAARCEAENHRASAETVCRMARNVINIRHARTRATTMHTVGNICRTSARSPTTHNSPDTNSGQCQRRSRTIFIVWRARPSNANHKKIWPGHPVR